MSMLQVSSIGYNFLIKIPFEIVFQTTRNEQSAIIVNIQPIDEFEEYASQMFEPLHTQTHT